MKMFVAILSTIGAFTTMALPESGYLSNATRTHGQMAAAEAPAVVRAAAAT